MAAALRVLHIATSRTWRGGEGQVRLLLRGLDELGGFTQGLLTPADSPLFARTADEFPGVERFPLRGRSPMGPTMRSALRRAIQKFRPDVLHAHTGHALTLCWWHAPRTYPVVETRRVDFSPKRPLWAMSGRKYLDRHIWHVAISNAVADVLRDAQVAGDRLRVIVSGLDADRFASVESAAARAAARDRIRRELGLEADAVLIGTTAALAGHKGLIHLVQAAALLRDNAAIDHPRIAIVVAGEGSERERLKRAITMEQLDAEHAPYEAMDKADLENKRGRVWMRLLGHRDDIPTLLAALDVFVFPSIMEGLGTAVLDALWMEKCVVASRVGGIPEMIRHGDNGLLVEPGRDQELRIALHDVATNPELRASLASRARGSLEGTPFTWKNMAAGYAALYAEITQSSSGTPSGS